jgi:hypothetical protein
MIPYTIIIASASRPHLLAPVLGSLMTYIDQKPEEVIVHDDAAFHVSIEKMHEAIGRVDPSAPIRLWRDTPPLGHGPSLHWLLNQVKTDYVLYSQDDHVVERTLPVSATLQVMDEYHLHHVRWNKRITADKKETTTGTFYKKEIDFGGQTLCVSDHWYFQTSLCRVSHLKPVVDWFMADPFEAPWFHERCEDKINRALDGFIEGFPPALNNYVDCDEAHDSGVRARKLRTFIWGKVNESRYVRHIGTDPADYALSHPRLG